MTKMTYHGIQESETRSSTIMECQAVLESRDREIEEHFVVLEEDIQPEIISTHPPPPTCTEVCVYSHGISR